MKTILVSCNTLDEWMKSIPSGVHRLENTQSYYLENEQEQLIFVYKMTCHNKQLEDSNQPISIKLYELDVRIELTGIIQGELGVATYLNNEVLKPKIYPLNKTIYLQGTNIEAFYITLKLKGKGTFKFEYAQLSQIERKEEKHTSESIKKFYRWYETVQCKEVVGVPLFNKRVATIVDNFTYECLKYEVYLKQLTYREWQKEIEAFHPDILFVESAWEGQNKSWKGKIGRYGRGLDQELIDLIKYCNLNHIPTFFWDKEGLKNIIYFAHAASLFDYIAVTDEQTEEIYKALIPAERVFVLPFAAQPKLHTIENYKACQLGNIGFAGSWYGKKYPERIKDIELLLEPALEYGLHIYDRNYSDESVEKAEDWPRKFRPYIVGTLPYTMMIEAYKQYSIFINIQSVKDSKWMIPRRVYELLACGVPIITSDSEGIKNQFPKEVYISYSQEETKALIEWIINNPLEVEKKSKEGREKILALHTYTHRVKEIFSMIGEKL